MVKYGQSILKSTLLTILFVSGCQTTSPNTSTSSLSPTSRVKILKEEKQFWFLAGNKGPYRVKTHQDLSIPIDLKTKLSANFYSPTTRTKPKVPLAIFIHGNRSYKEAHDDQAEHLASWGIASLTVSLPNTDEWVKNGEKIQKLTKLIASYPELLRKDLDHEKIILIGHSFGGSAISLAASKNAPIAGLILLDPALYKKSLVRKFKKITTPTILLGADKDVFKSKKREKFFKSFSGEFLELSIVGSTHDDAQSPSLNDVRFGFDFSTSDDKQRDFIRSITVAAFSLLNQKSPLQFAKNAFYRPLHMKKIENLRIK